MAAPTVLDRLRALLEARYTGDTTRPKPDGVNLIANGNFERDVVGQPAVGWTRMAGAVEMLVYAATLGTHSLGAHTVIVGTNANNIWRYRQTTPTPVEPNTSYTLNCGAYQIVAGATGFRLQIEWLDADLNLLSTASGPNETSGGPGGNQQHLFAATSPPEAAFQRAALDHNVNDISQYYVDVINLCPTAEYPGSPQASLNYRDGDTPGWVWRGVEGNSVSQTPQVTPTNDELLDAIIGGIADGAERLGIVAFGTDDIPVGRALDDPSVAPDWALPHAALYTSGGLLPGRKAGEVDADYLPRARDEAVYPLGILRGTDEAIIRTVQPLLTGTKTVIISGGGSAYSLVVRTITSETPNPAAVQAAIEGSYVSGGQRGAMRAELVLTYNASDTPTFSEATRAYSAVAGTVTAANVTRGDVT